MKNGKKDEVLQIAADKIQIKGVGGLKAEVIEALIQGTFGPNPEQAYLTKEDFLDENSLM